VGEKTPNIRIPRETITLKPGEIRKISEDTFVELKGKNLVIYTVVEPLKPCLRINDRLAVCVTVSKDPGKRDIILIDVERKEAVALRSVTELINQLFKRGLEFEKITDVIDFVSEKLLQLCPKRGWSHEI